MVLNCWCWKLFHHFLTKTRSNSLLLRRLLYDENFFSLAKNMAYSLPLLAIHNCTTKANTGKIIETTTWCFYFIFMMYALKHRLVRSAHERKGSKLLSWVTLRYRLSFFAAFIETRLYLPPTKLHYTVVVIIPEKKRRKEVCMSRIRWEVGTRAFLVLSFSFFFKALNSLHIVVSSLFSYTTVQRISYVLLHEQTQREYTIQQKERAVIRISFTSLTILHNHFPNEVALHIILSNIQSWTENANSNTQRKSLLSKNNDERAPWNHCKL